MAFVVSFVYRTVDVLRHWNREERVLQQETSAYALWVFQSRDSVVRGQMISREDMSYFHDWCRSWFAEYNFKSWDFLRIFLNSIDNFYAGIVFVWCMVDVFCLRRRPCTRVALDVAKLFGGCSDRLWKNIVIIFSLITLILIKVITSSCCV
jgi:hypothetical protein